jgi:glycosyltransferase involved in cell wall biosynthesis
VRVCIVYDCLFPYTVGGGERWYRSLAERLAGEGHEVTYLTLRQWPRDAEADLPGVRVVSVGPRMRLYGPRGTRRVGPPLVFGAGVLAHLMLHGRSYDAVHTSSFPYFSLLAAGLLRPLWRYRLFVDWFEVWTLGYWREYLGAAGGRVGWLVQRLCARVPQHAFCLSRLHAARLKAEGLRGSPDVLGGAWAGPLEPTPPREPEPLVVFAGRHIPEKRVPAIVPALALARREAPELRARILGDGPERPAVLKAIAEHGLEDVVSAPGFVAAEEVERDLARALCLVLPSRREGYGLVVVEASAAGTPSVVVSDPDSAASELIDEGENGFLAASAGAEELAAAILRVHGAGPELRERTRDWFRRNAERVSLGRSLRMVAERYSATSSR